MGCNNCKPGGQWTGGKGSWTGTNIQVNMENGYAHIEFDATLPGASEISIGKHVLKVTPIIQGSIITLRAAEAQFNIADGLYVLINTIKDIFNKLTGLFVYPS